jgi:hypothetical protein
MAESQEVRGPTAGDVRNLSVPGSDRTYDRLARREDLMDVFGLRERLVDDYEGYTRSFIAVRDERVAETVDAELERGLLWPDPLVQLTRASPRAARSALDLDSASRRVPAKAELLEQRQQPLLMRWCRNC